MGIAGCVLVDCDEPGHTAALGEHFAYAMAGSLGSRHAHIDARGGHDGFEVNIEAMREHDQLAGCEVRSDFFGVQLGLGLIGNQDHDHISPLCCFWYCDYFEAGFLRLANRF